MSTWASKLIGGLRRKGGEGGATTPIPDPAETTRRLTVGYITALGLVACLVVVGHGLVVSGILSHLNDGAVINLAGRQRMLSQRLAQEALLFAGAPTATAADSYQARLRDTLGEWTEAHGRLLSRDRASGLVGRNTATVEAMFAETQPLFDRLRRGTERLLSIPPAERQALRTESAPVMAVVDDSQAFLSAMDNIVDQYEYQAATGMQALVRNQAWLRAALFALLAFEALLIFRPLVKRTRHAQARLREANVQLAGELTERRRLHEELQRLYELKAVLLSTASHDLRSPLTAVIGYADMVLDGLSTRENRDCAECKATLERVTARARTMERIIADLVDGQAIENGALKLDLRPQNLNTVVRETAESLSFFAAENRITLLCELAEDLPSTRFDVRRIEQVVANLVGNAVKYGPHGSRVFVRTKKEPEHCAFEVEDQGPGVSAGDAEVVFERYRTLSRRPGGNQVATGLGLSICKDLVELHGGDIGVRNNSERGATFWFRLPCSGP